MHLLVADPWIGWISLLSQPLSYCRSSNSRNNINSLSVDSVYRGTTERRVGETAYKIYFDGAQYSAQ